MQNVIRPPPTGDAVLSQGSPQQADQLAKTQRDARDETDRHPQVGQHRRRQQARFVEHDAI
jgi:hypothetical protein